MDYSKVLYPNFHAEVHRYKAASAPSAKFKQQQQQQPHRSPVSRASGPRPNSSSSGHKDASSVGLSTAARPSSSSSPQKSHRAPLANANRASQSQGSNNSDANHPAANNARRRMLPPCVPTAASSKYAVMSDLDMPLRTPSAQQAFARQKSFCRIQDIEQDALASDGDNMDDDDDGDDDAEAPELLDSHQMLTQRSALPLQKPPSRRTAIRGELELYHNDSSADESENRELVLQDGASAAPAAVLRRNSSASPCSHGTDQLAIGAVSAASPLLLQCSSENLQELVFNARPRSRYARREHSRQSGRTLDRIVPATPPSPAAPALTAASSVPVLPIASHSNPHELSRNRSAPGVLITSSSNSNSSRHSLMDSARARDPLDVFNDSLSDSRQKKASQWDDDDISSFFLTELDAKAVETQWKLARSLARGAFLLYGACEFQKAAGHLSEALELAQGDDGLVALLSHHIGIAFKEDGKLQWAEAMQEKALVAAQRAGESRIRGRALKALGVLCMDAHEPAKALDRQQEALAIALEEKDAELEARVYANLGNIASLQMQLGHALSCHRRDLKLSTLPLAPSALGQLRAHRNLALVYAQLDKLDLQRDHEQLAALLGSCSDTFVHDMQTHPRSGTGNIYMHLSKRDPQLETMAVSCISDIVSEQQQQQRQHSQDHLRSNNSSISPNGAGAAVVAAVRPVQIKQVLITRASDRARSSTPPLSSSRSAMLLGNSSSLKRLS